MDDAHTEGWQMMPDCAIVHPYGEDGWRPGQDPFHEHWFEDGVDMSSPKERLSCSQIEDQETFDLARRALVAAGINNPEDSAVEQMRVFIVCIKLFQVRNKKYEDLWMTDGWQGTAHHIRHKAGRICRKFLKHQDGTDEPDAEDVWDLINYCGFLIRNLARRDKYGNL